MSVGISEALDEARKELVIYQQKGLITFEERMLIWSKVSGWLRSKSPIYIEYIKLFFLERELEFPSFVSKYDLEATMLRLNGDTSKAAKVITEMKFHKAFMCMAYFKAVGATSKDAAYFSAIEVYATYGKVGKWISASSIEKKYTKEFKGKSVSSNSTIENDIKDTLNENEDLKLKWKDHLDKFESSDLSKWEFLRGTRGS